MTARTRIEELVQRKLLGRKIDPVGVVDALLALVLPEGELRCTCAGNGALRFTIADPRLDFEVPVDRARAKLRMMCARLGVLCNDSGGQDVSLYGGEGVISEAVLGASGTAAAARPQSQSSEGTGIGAAAAQQVATADQEPLRSPRRWAVQFQNTPSAQEFTIRVP